MKTCRTYSTFLLGLIAVCSSHFVLRAIKLDLHRLVEIDSVIPLVLTWLEFFKWMIKISRTKLWEGNVNRWPLFVDGYYQLQLTKLLFSRIRKVLDGHAIQ